MLPNLIIAGVPKAGTTSLFLALASHADVCGSRIKETQYFRPLLDGCELPPIGEYEASFARCGAQRYRSKQPQSTFMGAPTLSIE